MYRGEYNHTIDAKGRIMIPVKIREQLGDSFVVSKGLDGCLWMMDNEEWKRLEDEIHSMPFGKKETRMLARFIFAGAADGELDKQGRVLIPPVLREFAGLEKDVVLSGVGSRVEIWDKEKYSSYNDDENMEMVADKLADLGFGL